MDRTFFTATIVFAALTIAGAGLTAFASQIGGDAAVVRSLGAAVVGGGLAAFLVQAFDWDRRRTRG
ncbi:MAG TPA: hypothetical protein VIR16_06235 [Candidatus Limnocylindrales bacterium]